jgi:hypothetical protein
MGMVLGCFDFLGEAFVIVCAISRISEVITKRSIFTQARLDLFSFLFIKLHEFGVDAFLVLGLNALYRRSIYHIYRFAVHCYRPSQSLIFSCLHSILSSSSTILKYPSTYRLNLLVME